MDCADRRKRTINMKAHSTMNGFIAEMGFRIIHLYPAGTNGGRVASLTIRSHHGREHR